MKHELHSILWRRLDVPGHDACLVEAAASGWSISGSAIFLHDGTPAQLLYSVSGGDDWLTHRGRVEGFVGSERVGISIERAIDGTWTVDGRRVPGLEDCVHLDFGFTPATNFPQLRRLALADGLADDLDVAWIGVPPSALQRLHQRYERRGRTAYWYESPSAQYAALLEVTSAGLIRCYPSLWEVEDYSWSS